MLDKMGGITWAKTREKVKAATRKLAAQLLQIQAVRMAAKGYAFSPPDELYEEFEATFPFEETPDQERAICEVLANMQEDKPMDRLVCGDVGYGKTEVAMRAAFKCATNCLRFNGEVSRSSIQDSRCNTASSTVSGRLNPSLRRDLVTGSGCLSRLRICFCSVSMAVT